MLVKVLHACAIDRRFWVFVTPGTNVRVEDTQASVTKTEPGFRRGRDSCASWSARGHRGLGSPEGLAAQLSRSVVRKVREA